MLSQRLPGVQLVGRSDLQGFLVFGNVDATTLRAAAEDALARLQAGEVGLAIHPNCGTNLVTAGALSGMAALLFGGGRKRSLWDRLPAAILGATLALLVAPPVGRLMQARVTTTGKVQDLRVASVVKLGDEPVPRHRVVIQDQ